MGMEGRKAATVAQVCVCVCVHVYVSAAGGGVTSCYLHQRLRPHLWDTRVSFQHIRKIRGGVRRHSRARASRRAPGVCAVVFVAGRGV